MESEVSTPFRPRSARLIAAASLPEVEFYFHLLVLIHLIDTECYNEVGQLYEFLRYIQFLDHIVMFHLD